MILEKFPIKEKLATDLDSQLAWLVREMGYSRDKTKGYEEKLVRLGREPREAQSVFGFMGNYWLRFLQTQQLLNSQPSQQMVTKSLQANAKVVAGLSDKVAFAEWLGDRINGLPHESERLIDGALDAIRDRVGQMQGAYTDEALLHMDEQSFVDNPLGQAVLGLHKAYKKDPRDIKTLRAIAIEGSAAGILMWQAYARRWETEGYSVQMPKPGLSSGNLEPWVDES